ncbi:hypothetical protein BJ912DRAFT_995494, partial [Pholiota molesta]
AARKRSVCVLRTRWWGSLSGWDGAFVLLMQSVRSALRAALDLCVQCGFFPRVRARVNRSLARLGHDATALRRPSAGSSSSTHQNANASRNIRGRRRGINSWMVGLGPLDRSESVYFVSLAAWG